MTTKTATKVLDLAEGTTATCVYCAETITLDVSEGGGDPRAFGAWDWGTPWEGLSGGLDYGCSDSPDTNDEGTGGHSPIWETIKRP